MVKIKGQSSLEFLMTYGWAIVIIIVVLLVAWQMGVFNPAGTLRPTFLGFWGVKPFDCSYMSNGNLTLSLQNNVGGDVNVTEINVSVGGKSYSTGTLALPISMGNITKWGVSQTTSGLPKYSAGSSYNIFVSIDYIDSRLGSGTTFRSSGNIRGTVESS
ncbi:MAG TPA: hypothetical protein ENF58_03195 [Candidatus Altiarchaeales archaeon]|nr:hypothetical protein [Candidatus Altiarchaeales archaeon]